jgi:hypothetical protein
LVLWFGNDPQPSKFLKTKVPDHNRKIGFELAFSVILVPYPLKPFQQLPVDILDKIGHIPFGQVALIGQAPDNNPDNRLILDQQLFRIFMKKLDINVIIIHQPLIGNIVKERILCPYPAIRPDGQPGLVVLLKQ